MTYLAENAKFVIIPGNYAIAYCDFNLTNKFVNFLPGPQDSLNEAIMPMRPIPFIFVKDVVSKVKHLSFGSNPSRIRYFTRDVMILRQDLTKRIRRHSIFSPRSFDEDKKTCEIISDYILSQAHLNPLPHSSQPFFWDLDHVFRLYPLPDLVRSLNPFLSFLRNSYPD
jgi:DNA polymerase epsilon subunit 2